MSSQAAIRQANHRDFCATAHFKAGDKVRSNYAKRWSGTVLEVVERVDRHYGDCRLLKVRQEIDRCGNPIPKGLRKKVLYNASLFEVLPARNAEINP